MNAVIPSTSLVRNFISNLTNDKYYFDNPIIESNKHVFEVSNNVELYYNSNPGWIIDKSEFYTYTTNSEAKAIDNICNICKTHIETSPQSQELMINHVCLNKMRILIDGACSNHMSPYSSIFNGAIERRTGSVKFGSELAKPISIIGSGDTNLLPNFYMYLILMLC